MKQLRPPTSSGVLLRLQRWLFNQPRWVLAVGIYGFVVAAAVGLAPMFYYLAEGRLVSGIFIAAFGTSTALALPLMWLFLSIAYLLIEQQAVAARSRADSERQRDILRVLLDASLLIQQKEDLLDLLEGTIQQLQQLFPAHHFGLLLYGRRRHLVRHLVAPGFSEAEQRLLLTESQLLVDGQPERLFERLAASSSGESSWQWALFPLWNRQDQTIGHLLIKGSSLPEHSRRTIELFRDQLAAAVENHLLRLELIQLANTDGLTGIYNRSYFQKALRQHQEGKRQSAALDFSLLMIDINGLKPANDGHGHRVGDQIIIRVAQRLKMTCRSEDIVCRIGGDEFAIICPGSKGDQAQRLAARIRDQVDGQPLKLNAGQELLITLSIGIACSDETDPEQLMILADQRMYADKQRFYAQQAQVSG